MSEAVKSPTLGSVKKQMIIPLVDILERIDVRLSDRWCDGDVHADMLVRQSINLAMHAWCKHGWLILIRTSNTTHQVAMDLMVEFWRAEQSVESDKIALAIFKSLYPIMRTFEAQDHLFLDTVNPVFTEPDVIRRIGGDIILEASYIKTY